MSDIIEIILQTRLKGADEIKAGAAASKHFADMEDKAAAALARTARAYDLSTAAAKKLAEMQKQVGGSGSIGPLSMGGSGASSLVSMTSQMQARVARLTEAHSSGSSNGGGSGPSDITAKLTRLRAAASLLEGAPGPVGTVARSIGNLTGAAEGGGMGGVTSAIGKLPPQVMAAGAALAAVAGVAVVVYKVGETLAKMQLESAKLTQAFSDARVKLGGSSLDAGRAQGLARITGVEAGGAARAFNDRITSDPMAMGMAAQLGISNMPGPFGKRDFGKQYMQAVERISKIQDDDMRARMAQVLGIEQEVNRYTLLAPNGKGTKGSQALDRMKRFGQTTSRVNNPEAERRAAELSAAVDNEAQARENLKTAWGNLAQDFLPFTVMINKFADFENAMANGTTNLQSIMEKVMPNTYGTVSTFHRDADERGLWGKAMKGVDQQIDYSTDGSGKAGGGSNDYATAQAANTAAMIQNTAALAKLSGVWGNSERAQNAMPSAFNQNAQLHTGAMMRGLQLGTLL